MNPTTLSIAQGANGTSTVNITRTNGFAGAVTLTATGLTAGVEEQPHFFFGKGLRQGADDQPEHPRPLGAMDSAGQSLPVLQTREAAVGLLVRRLLSKG